MAVVAAPGEQTGPGLDRGPDGGDNNIFTKTLAALQGLATDLPAYISRIPPKDSLDARQQALAQSGGSTEQISVAGRTVQLRLRKRAGEGTFGIVFSGDILPDGQADAQTAGKQIAVKLEPRKLDCPQLRDEFRTYKLLQGCPGIPNVYHFGEVDFHKALVMDLLGPSVESYFVACGKKFSVKTVAMLARQMITRLQTVHEKGLIYRDIKPENFLVGVPGTPDVTTVYLVDFGMAKAYRDPDTHAHIPNAGTRALSGTARYMSINAHNRRTQSRRDDIEALGHVLLYLVRGRLPWQGPKTEDADIRHERMLERKVATTIQDLCAGCPSEFSDYITYARGLNFTDTPDYDYLRLLFSKILTNQGLPDDGVYDWMLLPASELAGMSPNRSAVLEHADTTSHQVAAGATVGTRPATPSARKTRTLFYDSTTQQALFSLYRDIMADRYKFHRTVGTVDVGRRSRVSSAIRTTTAAATKAANAVVSSVAAHTASLPSNTYTRPLVQPISNMLASMVDSSSCNSSIELPSSVISTSFTKLVDNKLGKVIAELEDMCDKQLQNGDWSAGRTRVCSWIDELAAAVPEEQQRVHAAYAKWKEELQAEKLARTNARAADAAPTSDGLGLQVDDGGPSLFEADMPLQLDVDDHSAAKRPGPLAATPAGSPVAPDLQDMAGPQPDDDDHNSADQDDLDNPEAISLVFRTASGSRKVVRLNKN